MAWFKGKRKQLLEGYIRNNTQPAQWVGWMYAAGEASGGKALASVLFEPNGEVLRDLPSESWMIAEEPR